MSIAKNSQLLWDNMIVKSLLFVLIAYGIAIVIALLVTLIVKGIAVVVRRGEKSVTAGKAQE